MDDGDFLPARLGHLKGHMGDPLARPAGDAAHRERHVRRRHELAAAERHVPVRIEALGVLPDHDKIMSGQVVAHCAVTGTGPERSLVDEEVEGEPHLEQ